jgi:hypothetical protein
VTPWGTYYSNADAVAGLVVRGGEATGPFTRPVEFTKMRAQRLPRPEHGRYVEADRMDSADVSTTAITEAEFVTGTYTAVPFAVGLRVRGGVLQVVGRPR